MEEEENEQAGEHHRRSIGGERTSLSAAAEVDGLGRLGRGRGLGR
jgi:hypothetical protein